MRQIYIEFRNLFFQKIIYIEKGLKDMWATHDKKKYWNMNVACQSRPGAAKMKWANVFVEKWYH